MLFLDPVNIDVCVPWYLECADGGAEAIFAWPLGPLNFSVIKLGRALEP